MENKKNYYVIINYENVMPSHGIKYTTKEEIEEDYEIGNSAFKCESFGAAKKLVIKLNTDIIKEYQISNRIMRKKKVSDYK